MCIDEILSGKIPVDSGRIHRNVPSVIVSPEPDEPKRPCSHVGSDLAKHFRDDFSQAHLYLPQMEVTDCPKKEIRGNNDDAIPIATREMDVQGTCLDYQIEQSDCPKQSVGCNCPDSPIKVTQDASAQKHLPIPDIEHFDCPKQSAYLLQTDPVRMPTRTDYTQTPIHINPVEHPDCPKQGTTRPYPDYLHIPLSLLRPQTEEPDAPTPHVVRNRRDRPRNESASSRLALP